MGRLVAMISEERLIDIRKVEREGKTVELHDINLYEVVPYFFYNDQVKKKAKSYGLTPDSPGEIVIVVITARKTMHAIGPEYDWENEAYEPFSYEYVSWPESFLETVSHDAVWSTRGENHS
ncbi:hypothetical protein ADUPG1_001301, partial [Aduncisulcus paluster]